MKKIVLLLLMASTVAWGQNALTLTGGSGHPGDTLTVSLSMDNSDAVSALQCFVPMGSDMKYVAGSATLGTRGNGHTLSATVYKDTLRIYCYSISLATFSGTSGEVLTFRVVLGKEPGNHTLQPVSCVLSSATGSPLTISTTSGTGTILAPKVQITPSSLDYGHVPIRSSYTKTFTIKNIGNEELTISSITTSDTVLVGSEPTALSAGAQQTITLTYNPVRAGSTTMSAIVHTNANVGDSVLTVVADPYSVNELHVENASGYTDSIVTISLRMNNMDSIVGLQTMFILPEALSFVEGSFAVSGSRKADHTATAGLTGDTLTLLLASLSGSPLHGADGVVATFAVQLHGYGSYYLHPLGTVLSDSAARNVVSGQSSGSVQIYSPRIVCSSSLNLGNTPVTDTATATLTVSNSGNAALVIDRVVFTQSGWQLTDSLPLTIANGTNSMLHVQYTGTAEGTHTADMLLYSNDPFSNLVRVVVNAQRYEPNHLYMASTGDYTLDIMLDNYSSVTALQMDVRYPKEYYSLTGVQTTARSSSHIVSTAAIDDSTLRLLVLSMNNTPFSGNSGAVATMQFTPADDDDETPYLLQLLNVTTACTDGVNRLTAVDDIVYIATHTVYDTAYVHDTAYVNVPYAVHDTTVITDTLTLTEYIAVHDTTVITDTLTLTEYIAVHDTTVITDTLTLTEYIAVHDTTVITDTLTLTEYIAVHDTIVITDTLTLTEYIAVHDTTIITDTLTLTEYVAVHDTSYISIYDTAYITLTDTVTNTIYDTITKIVTDTVTNTVYDTTVVYSTDTLWLRDTVLVHDTIYVYDTVYVGVEGVETVSARIYTSGGQIVVDGAEGNMVWLYDVNGRVLAIKRDAHEAGASDAPVRFDVPASGAYLVKIGTHAARKVVVIR